MRVCGLVRRWVTAAETKEQVAKRMEELVHQIHYSPHERIVLVGHSHFFRALFQRFLHSEVGCSTMAAHGPRVPETAPQCR